MRPSSAVRPSRPLRHPLSRRAVLALALLAPALLVVVAGAARAAVRASAAAVVAAEGERTLQGAKLAVRGTGWPARAAVVLSASTPPGGSKALDLGTATANASGEFRVTKLSPCTTPDSAAAARAYVTITAATTDGAQSATASIAALPWACLPR